MPGERFIVGVPDNSPEDDLTTDFGDSCLDLKGRLIAGGHQYVPGPDSCTVCLCESGKPKWCQAVLCVAPKDCKSFRIGSSCCDFICLDNANGGRDEGSTDVSWGEGNWVSGDLGLRMVATAVTAILSLALLAFLFYRLRRRRMQRLAESGATLPTGSMSSLNGIHGDLTSSMGHLSRQPHHLLTDGENHSPVYLMWKLPTAAPDAPPPYTVTAGQTGTMQNSDERDNDHHETIGLLSAPSAPARDLEEVERVRSSTDTLNSDLLGRGTPPPSYAEVLAAISVNRLDESADEELALSIAQVPPSRAQQEEQQYGEQEHQLLLRTQQQNNRMSLSLPRERNRDSEAAIQRFSLQLALDWSDTSSCSSSGSIRSSTISQAQALSSSSSSSAASLAVPIDNV